MTFGRLRDHRSINNHRKILENKYHSRMFGSFERFFKDLRKIFEINAHSKIFRRPSLVEVIQGSSRSQINQGISDNPPYHRSFEDLRKSFEIRGHSRIFGKFSRSNIIQGSWENLREQISFKDIRKIFEIQDHSRTFGRFSRSKIIQRSLEDDRDHRSFRRSSRSKIIQELLEDLRKQRSSKGLRQIFEIKYNLRRRPDLQYFELARVFSLYTDVDKNSNVSVDNDVYTEFFDN